MAIICYKAGSHEGWSTDCCHDRDKSLMPAVMTAECYDGAQITTVQRPKLQLQTMGMAVHTAEECSPSQHRALPSQ